VRRRDGTVRLVDAESGARGHDDHKASFVAVLGRRRAFDHLHGLHGIHGDLVGEDLALLIGDGLAIDGERILGVIAHAVKEAVGVGGDAGRGEGDERA